MSLELYGGICVLIASTFNLNNIILKWLSWEHENGQLLLAHLASQSTGAGVLLKQK